MQPPYPTLNPDKKSQRFEPSYDSYQTIGTFHTVLPPTHAKNSQSEAFPLEKNPHLLFPTQTEDSIILTIT
jgi:hypothetical protein